MVIREFLELILEICFAILIIILGYIVWNSFAFFDYQVAIDSDNIKMVEVMTSEEILYLHNISKNDNNINLVFKVETEKLDEMDNFILEFQNKKFNLKEINRSFDNRYSYYSIENIEFEKYETKDFNFKIINDSEEYVYYEFITI